MGSKMGGSGKRKLADGSLMSRNTIGKLRRLRLPLPPVSNRMDLQDPDDVTNT